MFNIFTHCQKKKAALEKYADSLNKIVNDHVKQSPETSPQAILLQHAGNCDLAKYGDENQPAATKRKRTTGGVTSKTTKRKKAIPLEQQNQNLNEGTGEIRSAAHTKKMAAKAQEASAVTAMQVMQTSTAVSNSFVRSFPSTTQYQVRDKSDVTIPILIPPPDHGPLVVV